MKTVYLILLLIVVSCGQPKDKPIVNLPKLETKVSKAVGNNYSCEVLELKIDYCEYIIINQHHSTNIIHKANCSNNFHGNK